VFREQLDGASARITEGRVFIGGLPELWDVESAVRTMLAGHDVRRVGELTRTTAEKRSGQNHFYCFVDFDTAAEVEAVVAAFGGNEMGLIVDFARELGREDAKKRDVSPPDVKAQRDYSKSWRRQDVSGVV
jgi:hypothetical protein